MAKKKMETKENQEKVHDEKERRSTIRFYTVLISVMAVFFLLFYFWTTNFTFVLVDGKSMDETLRDGEYLLSYKVVHPEYELQRGDIIVVEVGHIPEWQAENAEKPADRRTNFIIKRLIALEGDIVRCTDGEMEICYAGTWNELMNPADYPFVAIDEPYAFYDETAGGKSAPCNTFQYKVGEGEIFFLGDNRNRSSDSRYRIVEEDGRINHEYSALKNRLYKAEDVIAVVPQWALNHQKGLQKYLVDIPNKIGKAIAKPFKKLKG